MLDLLELKRFHDKAYDNGQVTRERASDDIVFAHVTQWDDNLLGESQLQYRGQFDLLRKAMRAILSDLRSKPVSINFEPKSTSREDGADLLDGLFLSDERHNTTIEAYNNASMEAVVCGVGAWLLHTDYETTRAGDSNQVIRRKPLYEANNNVFWDPNAKLLDKSDADYVSILHPFSEDGYKKLSEELTGEEEIASSFAYPEESYVFPWQAEDAKVYVVEFYHREKVKDKVFTMVDPFDQPIMLRESDLEDVMDEMIDSGYKIESEKVIERWQVTKYIASGKDILKEEVIAGENIPVVPTYGERAFVEGEEHYEGITRLAKDPQRLRNFQLSYLADIVSRSPRPKPIFFPEQIQGFENMYEENGADNNFPYYLQNMLDANGNPLPIGPVAEMPEQRMPQALVASIGLSREAVNDVAPAGIPEDVAETDASGKAIRFMTERIDEQSLVYQDHIKHAKRRDAAIYASMASDIYDAPRSVTLTDKEGKRKTSQVMEIIMDKETGEPVVLNDLTNVEFDVFAEIGPSYSSKKEQTLETLSAMVASLQPGDPLAPMLRMKMLKLIDGVDFEDIREYANKQLLIMGLREPEDEEEEAELQAMQQQGQEPSAEMVLAMAEDKKGQAALMKEQRETVKTQADIVNDQAQTQIDGFEAQTDRMDSQVNAQKAGAEINNKNIEAFGKQLDNMAKVGQELRSRAAPALRLTQ